MFYSLLSVSLFEFEQAGDNTTLFRPDYFAFKTNNEQTK
jgi:hypothetical protein